MLVALVGDPDADSFAFAEAAFKRVGRPRRVRGSFYIFRFSKSLRVLLILLNTGSLDSAFGDNGDGVLGVRSSEPNGLQTLFVRGLGLCLVASSPKSWPKLNGVVGRFATDGCWLQSSLKKLAMELVGDWLRLDDGEIESPVLPKEKVGLRFNGFGLAAPITELTVVEPVWW